jgi:homoserine kinase
MESVEVIAPATTGNIGPGFDVLGLAVKHWGDRIEAGADGMPISGSSPTVFAITDTLSRARVIQDAMVRAFKSHSVESTSIITEVDPVGARIIETVG